MSARCDLPTRSSVILIDTSVAVASMLPGHDGHEASRGAIRGRSVGLAGHAWFETVSVLTRLPPPQRRSVSDIATALARNFPETRWLVPHDAQRLTTQLPALNISGGAVYDALVAAVAVANNLPLLSRDRRAMATYQSLGAAVTLLI